MSNLKKKISFYKLEQIFVKSKLLLCCHCNNMNTLEWCLLKKELSKLNLLKGVNILLVKNKMAKNFINELVNHETSKEVNPEPFTGEINKEFIPIPNLFQGPTFIIGCNDVELVSPVIKLINSKKKFLVVGGVLQKKIINHLDVNLLKNLNNLIFNELINVLERPIVNLFSTSQKHTTDVLLLLALKKVNPCLQNNYS